MLSDNSCQLARLMVTSPAARGTRLTRNVFMRHRSRRRMDLMTSHVRFTIAVRMDVPTAAAIALNSVDPRRSPTIRQRSSITTSTTRMRLPPCHHGGLLVHHLDNCELYCVSVKFNARLPLWVKPGPSTTFR